MPDLRKPKEREGRIELSAYKLRKLREEWWSGEDAPNVRYSKLGWILCIDCGKEIDCFSDLTVEHIKPRGMGGGSRDDSPGNLGPAHWLCNQQKGSKRGTRP